MIVALMAASAVLALATGVPQLVEALNKRSRTARVKNFLVHLEVRVRSDSTRADSYVDCPGLCTLSAPLTARYHEQVRSVLGADCPTTNPSCGVLMELEDGGAKLNLKLTYQGREIKLAPRIVEIAKPSEFSSVRCNNLALPLFKGRHPDGSPICLALPAPCPLGEVMRGVNWSQMSYICVPIPSTPASCSDPNSYITGLSWDASYQIVPVCEGRLYDPWTRVL